MQSTVLQQLEQTPGAGIVLTVEFSRPPCRSTVAAGSLAAENLYNNPLQSHSREFFTLKGVKLLPGILGELQG